MGLECGRRGAPKKWGAPDMGLFPSKIVFVKFCKLKKSDILVSLPVW